MGETFQKRIADLMLSHKRHVRHVAILVCSALVVVMGVTLALTRPGQAKTHEEVVLDCQYSGNGAHTHDASCYDADGNLVCPLEEREYHVHDDSCYASETYLVCGMEEGEGAHTHTDECYDEEGNLICGMEESEGHVHTDECWQTDTWLDCGKEEVTEEHVHGEGCFKTVVVEDEPEPEPEVEGETPDETEVAGSGQNSNEDVATNDSTEATASSETTSEVDAAMPAQDFSGELKAIDADGNEYVAVVVQVKAPEGAFPKGTTMKIDWVADADVESVLKKVEDAVKKDKGDSFGIKQWQAVDISFRNAEGKAIEPAKDVEVKISSAKIDEIEEPVLVHVIDRSMKSANGKIDDAEIVGGVATINQDENDTTMGHENTFRFKAREFSPYVIVEIEDTQVLLDSMPEQHFEGIAGDVAVSVDAPAGALPENAEMRVSTVDAAEVSDIVQYAVEGEVQHVIAVDISFYDVDGNKIEPNAKLEVKLTSSAVADLGNPQLVHITDENVAELVTDVQVRDGASGMVSNNGDTVTFEADRFSVYAIVDSETITTSYLSADGETYEITVTFGPEAGIPSDAGLEVVELLPGDESYSDYIEAARTAVDESRVVTNAKLFDISIVKDGRTIEPAVPVQVSIRLLGTTVEDDDDLEVVHFSSKEEASVMPQLKGITTDEEAVGVDFKTDGFSVYAVVVVNEEGCIVYEGDGYALKVTFAKDAKIPYGTQLVVNKYDEGTPEFDNYQAQSVKALQKDDQFIKTYFANLMGLNYEPPAPEIKDIQTFDITLKYGDEVIEPEDLVSLELVYDESRELDDDVELNVIHFAKGGTEVIDDLDLTVDESGAIKAVTCQTDSFSAYSYTMAVVSGNRLQTQVTSDPSWVVRNGTLSNFTSNLPLGTVYVKTTDNVMNLNPEGQGTRYDFTQSGGFEIAQKGGYFGGNATCWAVATTGDEWRVPANSERSFPDKWFMVKYHDIATLQDGTSADFCIRFSNFRIVNSTNSPFGSGSPILGGDQGTWVSGPDQNSNRAHAWDFDIEFLVEKDGVRQENETFLFGMVDLDTRSTTNFTYYQVAKVGDKIIGYNPTIGSGVGNHVTSSLPIKEEDKIYLYQDAEGQTPLYWTDESQTETTSTETEFGLAYAKHVLRSHNNGSFTGYVTTERVNLVEGVTILEGMQSKVYIPTTNRLYLLDDPEGWRLCNSSVSLDSSTMNTGYFMLVDAGGFKLRWSGSGHIGTRLVSNEYYLRIDSSSDVGGEIGTYDTNYSGQQVAYGFTDPGIVTTVTVPKGKTQTYYANPDPLYHLDYVVVGRNLEDQEPLSNGDLNPFFGEMNDHREDYRFPYDLKYVSPENGQPGTYSITNCSVSVPTDGGTATVKQIAFTVDGSGDITGVSIDTGSGMVNYAFNEEEGSWSDGTTKFYQHELLDSLYDTRVAGQYDYNGGDGYIEVLGQKLSRIRYKTTANSDGTVSTQINVYDKDRDLWAGSDGWSPLPTFIEDENGSVRYTFSNVQNNWRIHVHWVKDDPEDIVTIKKVWNDDEDAHFSRPDNLVAWVKYVVNGEETTLTTGQDENINGGTTWIKSGSYWTYTFRIPFGAEIEDSSWFDEVEPEDYRLSNRELQREEQEDGAIYYTAILENDPKLVSFEFDKIDFITTRAVEGASFGLFTDKYCTHPLMVGGEAVVASSDEVSDASTGEVTKAAGVVRFESIPVGKYYMKETVIPENYYANDLTYYLDVHANSVKIYVYKADGSLYDPSTVTGIDNVQTAADNSPVPSGQDKRAGAVGIKNERYYVTNYCPGVPYPILLEKQDVANSETKLEGAEFKLYINEVKDENLVRNGNSDVFVTGSDGRVKLFDAGLNYGTEYILVETKAPEGYVLPDGQIKFVADSNNTVRYLEPASGEVFSPQDDGTGNMAIILVAKNTAGAQLPKTGGPGTTLFTITGTALCAAAAVMYGFTSRRRREGRLD